MSTNPQPGSQPKPQQPTPAAATATPTTASTPASTAPAKPLTSAPAPSHAPAKQKPAKPKKKVGLNSVVSWGASVVIIGLMFKILHWKGGEIFITIGLSAEAILFTILGFAAMAVPEDTHAHDDHKDEKKDSGLEELLASAITPKIIERLSKGFEQFNKTVESVNQIAGSFNVTQNMLKEMETATTDMKKFRDNLNGVTVNFDQFGKSLQSVNQLATTSATMIKDIEGASVGLKSFTKNTTDLNASFDQFTKTLAAINQMTASTQTMLKEFEAATAGMKAYNQNMAAITKVYQAQLDAFKK